MEEKKEEEKVVSTYTLTCDHGDFSTVIVDDFDKAGTERDLHEIEYPGHTVTIDVATT